MSTISSSTVNPYLVGYSTNDLSGSDTTASKYSASKSTSGTGSSSSSGSYSQGLVSQMSGLDTNSLVNESMASDVIKLNSLLSKEQQSQWTQDRYQSIITNMQSFSSKYFDILSDNYILSANSFSINAANSSNTNVLDASASNSAQTGTYSVTSATLAMAANIPGAAQSSSVTSSTTMSSLNSDFTNGGTLSFNVGTTPVSYTFTGSTTISQVMSDLTNKTGLNFNYSELNKTFSISSKSTGDSSNININNITSNSTTNKFFNDLYGQSGTTVTAKGVNGEFTISGPDGTGTVSEASNNFTIDGVSYKFSGDTSKISAANPVTINVKQDVASVVNKIQSFVTDYNNLIDGISSVTNEKKDYSYSPLTSSQESQMTASQITAWNQKAQQGLLANDGTLTDMLSEMRAAFYTPVSGNGLTMGGIGLSTSDDPAQGGKITIDVKKLTSALQSNPQGVIDLFNKASTSSSTYEDALNTDTTSDSSAVGKAIKQRNGEEGIFQRLSDIEKKYAGTYVDKNGNQGILLMKAGMPGTFSETRNTLYKQIKDQATAVTDFKTQMTQDASMYTKKYSALQAMLSQLSSQQNYLSSMLSSSSS